MFTTLIYSLLALDQTIAQLAAQYGAWLYALLFLVIFAETGLVVFPFLPGDSILFIAGTVVAVAELNIHVLAVILVTAAVRSATSSARAYSTSPIRAGSSANTCCERRRSTTGTAASRSSSAASCRSFARSRRFWPAWRA